MAFNRNNSNLTLITTHQIYDNVITDTSLWEMGYISKTGIAYWNRNNQFDLVNNEPVQKDKKAIVSNNVTFPTLYGTITIIHAQFVETPPYFTIPVPLLGFMQVPNNLFMSWIPKTAILSDDKNSCTVNLPQPEPLPPLSVCSPSCSFTQFGPNRYAVTNRYECWIGKVEDKKDHRVNFKKFADGFIVQGLANYTNDAIAVFSIKTNVLANNYCFRVERYKINFENMTASFQDSAQKLIDNVAQLPSPSLLYSNFSTCPTDPNLWMVSNAATSTTNVIRKLGKVLTGTMIPSFHRPRWLPDGSLIGIGLFNNQCTVKRITIPYEWKIEAESLGLPETTLIQVGDPYQPCRLFSRTSDTSYEIYSYGDVFGKMKEILKFQLSLPLINLIFQYQVTKLTGLPVIFNIPQHPEVDNELRKKIEDVYKYYEDRNDTTELCKFVELLAKKNSNLAECANAAFASREDLQKKLGLNDLVESYHRSFWAK